MKKIFAHIVVLVLLCSVGGILVHAQTPAGGTSNTGISGTIPNPFNCGGSNSNGQGGCDLGTFLNTIINSVVLPLGGILVILAFIWVGFMFVTSRGKPAELETARRYLLYVAIGTAVLLGAVLISNVIQNTVKQL
jgi:hypothetical protein